MQVSMVAVALQEHKLKIFVSYSRANTAFADELVAGLRYDDRFDVTIDRQSIIEGEDWKLRLGALIADADTIVFVLSPASAKSKICGWEVDEAKRLSKRILPVLAEPVGKVPVPAVLAALNYVRFDPQDNGEQRSFMAGLKSLARALYTDVPWLRQHTNYQTLAHSWVEAGRSLNRLLSGPDIVAAKNWAANHPKDAPEVTELHLEFFKASEVAEAAETSRERQQLADIEAAHKAREEALVSAEKAMDEQRRSNRRLFWRTLTLGAVVAGVTVVAMASIFYLNRARADLAAQKLAADMATINATVAKAEAEKAIQRAKRTFGITNRNAAGQRAMQRVCSNAVDVATRLATTKDVSSLKTLTLTFDEYFYGDMLLVEEYQRWATEGADTSSIEQSMVGFSNALKGSSQTSEALPRKSLCVKAKAIQAACNTFLKMNAPEPCQ